MAWYNSAIHAVGNLVGPTLEAAGGVQDLLPGKGTSQLTNLGHNITSPTVTLSNPSGILGAASASNGNNNSAFSGAGAYNPAYTTAGNSSAPKMNPNTADQSTDPGSGQVLGQSTINPTTTAYNTYKNEANSALNDLLGQYNTAVNKENSAYTTQNNTDQSAYNQQKANYDNQVTGQNQDLLRQTNQDEQGVSNAYRNLMNLLGAYGGGASSVALQWAPNAARTYQNKLLSGDKATTAANLANLASNWGTYQNQYDQKKQQDLYQHNNNLAQAQADYNQTKAQLNSLLGNINTQALDPGTIGTKLDDIEASIPNNVFVNPTYTGVTPAYTAPSLASFESTMPTASINSNSAPNNSATPALYYLLSQSQQKNQNQPVLA